MANQILKKWIGDNQVDQEKILLDNNSAMKSKNAAGNAEKDLIKLSGADRVVVKDVTDPVDPHDAAHKQYVDDQIDSISLEASNISVTPAGNLSSTNVQDALEELQGDLDNIDLDASNVNVTPTGNLASTNAQDALEELQLDIDSINNSIGSPSGIAPLNSSSKIDAIYLPSFVDDVEEYANLAAFPASGEAGKIYVALDTSKIYRWSGSTYIEISPSEVNSVNGETGFVSLDSDDISEGSTNQYFTESRARTAAVSDEAFGISWDNVLNIAPSKNAVYDKLSGLDSSIAALEQYKQETVWVDAISGVDAVGRGSMLRPYRTINYAYSQVQSLGNPSNTTYNANVEKFVTEKLVIHLAPGRYTENVVLGFKRARVRLVGDGATIVGDVKMSVKLADFPCASLENFKSSFPAPFTGGSAFMNFEIVGKSGGGLESDPTANVLVITGIASLAFEETTVPGSGVIFPNWDGSYGQFYAYLDGASMGNFVVTTSHSAATPTLPAGVIEVESCNIAAANQTYRQHFGIVPYAYLTDFATWNVATKGSTNKTPSGTWTLKAHNSTFGNVIGPRLTIGEMDGCRIYDIDRTMRGTVDNGAISGSTSTSYLGIINNQFRIFSGSGDLASAYKIGQASGSTRYKIDSVSYTTLAFSRNSSGVLTARTLDVGAGVSYDLLDDARSIFVNDAATNYSRTGNTVEAALEGIDNALGSLSTSLSSTAEIMKKVLTSTDITNGYIDLPHLAKMTNDLHVFADRVALHQGALEDYSLSTVGGVTRITFLNDMIGSGIQKLEAGDSIYVRYKR